MSNKPNEYQLAGELFGLVKSGLGFGTLVMFQDDDQRFFRYQWTFNAKGKTYCCERVANAIELKYVKCIHEMADFLVGRMKDEFRKVYEPAEPPERVDA